MKVPYVDLAAQHAPLRQALLEAVGRVLDHGWFVLGPEVGELEARLAERIEVPAVVGVNSGTDALILALRALGVGPGDEVITVSHSFVATASAIRLVGATPVFVDIDEDTMLLDPTRLEAARTASTKAVLPVHLGGFACDLTAIATFCDAHGLHLLEDCAQAIGAKHRGRPVGSVGVGAWSLHPLKVLSACGDAGFVSLPGGRHEVLLRELRNLGLRTRDDVAHVSGNSRLDTLQAAMLLVKLGHLDEWIAARRAHAAAYRGALRGWVRLPPEEGDDFAVYSAFVVRHPRRDALVEGLLARGIDAKVHYPKAIHQQPPFADVAQPLPVTERVVREIVSLPVTPELTEAGREQVIAAVRAVCGEIGDAGA